MKTRDHTATSWAVVSRSKSITACRQLAEKTAGGAPSLVRPEESCATIRWSTPGAPLTQSAPSSLTTSPVPWPMGQAVQAFTDDPVGFVIDLGSDMSNSAVNDMITCYKGLSGQAPSCMELNTLKACVNTALNAVSGAKAASSGVTTANLKRLDSGLSKMDKVLSVTTDMCRMGCEGGVCGTSDGASAETLMYSTPAGCVCREMYFTYDGNPGVTPMDCARNLYSAGLKLDFPYMGCYVGVTDDPASYSSCTPAYESRVFDNAMFVRCLDQFGRQLNLKDGTTGTGTASTGTGTGSSVPTIQRTVSGWLLLLLVATLWLQ